MITFVIFYKIHYNYICTFHLHLYCITNVILQISLIINFLHAKQYHSPNRRRLPLRSQILHSYIYPLILSPIFIKKLPLCKLEKIEETCRIPYQENRIFFFHILYTKRRIISFKKKLNNKNSQSIIINNNEKNNCNPFISPGLCRHGSIVLAQDMPRLSRIHIRECSV